VWRNTNLAASEAIYGSDVARFAFLHTDRRPPTEGANRRWGG
jgi:hypothetical protein